MKGRIALVQFRSSTDDETNIRRMENFIKQESQRSDLIVFPELAIKKTFSEVEEGVLLELFSAIAKKNMIDVVPGSVLVRSRGKSYNRSYYIDRNGKVLAAYDKSNPWRSEKIAKGKGPAAFKTRFGRTALIICWDLESPMVASKLSTLKLDLIICPSMWWQGSEAGRRVNFTEDMIDSLCLARAYESRSSLVFANAAGRLKMKGFFDRTAGRSQAVAPFLNLIAEAKSSGECVVRCRVDPASLVLARKYFS
jgi:predicted amidohydrolase